MAPTDLYAAYGELARRVDDPIVAAARYPFQSEAIAEIAPDVATKLGLEIHHRLLEIGFGSGALLLPLATYVEEVVGVDQSAYVERLRPLSPKNAVLVEGKWPHDQPSGTFDRVVVYSVLQYLESRENAIEFLDAVVAILRPGGALLVGDIPNEDALRRFVSTPFGSRFEDDWRKRTRDYDDLAVETMRGIFSGVKRRNWKIDDRFVINLVRRYRALHLEAYVLPQSPRLPFGFTREDVLVRRR